MKALVLLGLLLGCNYASADTFFIKKPKLVGVKEVNSETVYELVSSSLKQQGHAVSSSAEQSNYQLRAKLLKLGDSFIMTLDKTKGQSVVFTTKLKSDTAEDLDIVTNRLVRAVISEKNASADAQVDDVTASEVHKGTNRRKALKRWYFGFGPAWLKNVNGGDSGTNWSLAYNFDVDPQWALRIFLDSMAGTGDADESRITSFGIGGAYVPGLGNNSWFAMADIGHGTAEKNDPSQASLFSSGTEDISGFVLGVGVGYLFFRTSSVNLDVVLRYAQHLKSFANGNKANATLMRVGLYF